MTIETLIIAILSTQFASFLALILMKQICKNLSEKTIFLTTIIANLLSIFLIIALAISLTTIQQHAYFVDLGTWLKINDYQYEITFIADILAIIYSLFSMILIGIIAVFSRRYMHREQSYYRFYTCMNLFSLGIILISFAGELEVIIIGWEFVGIASVLLISFFNYRQTPIKNAFQTFINYRICDIGLFAALILMHSVMHDSNFHIFENAKWFEISSHHAPEILGFLILFATMGKSALFPFSNWLPRAMEGPTPSSAIFYGAISIHFGPLLLLRSADLIAHSNTLSYTIIFIGLLTAFLGFIIAHHQNDIKSMLAYSSISQVGLIVAEIGFGFNIIALIHILGHSSFRTLQILRAPSLIHDLRNIEELLGHEINRQKEKQSKLAFFFYHLAFEKFFMDKILKDLIIANILKPFHAINKFEQKLSNFILRKYDK